MVTLVTMFLIGFTVFWSIYKRRNYKGIIYALSIGGTVSGLLLVVSDYKIYNITWVCVVAFTAAVATAVVGWLSALKFFDGVQPKWLSRVRFGVVLIAYFLVIIPLAIIHANATARHDFVVGLQRSFKGRVDGVVYLAMMDKSPNFIDDGMQLMPYVEYTPEKASSYGIKLRALSLNYLKEYLSRASDGNLSAFFDKSTLGAELVRTIGIVRARCKIGMTNLVYNITP